MKADIAMLTAGQVPQVFKAFTITTVKATYPKFQEEM